MLFQNAPNPVKGCTNFIFELGRPMYITLTLTDVTGIKVAGIGQGMYQTGKYSMKFDCGDIAPGIYFYTLEADGIRLTRKMVIAN